MGNGQAIKMLAKYVSIGCSMFGACLLLLVFTHVVLTLTCVAFCLVQNRIPVAKSGRFGV